MQLRPERDGDFRLRPLWLGATLVFGVLTPSLAGDVTIGGARPTTLHVPENYDPQVPAPLILFLHGCPSDAAGPFGENVLRLGPAAKERGILFAAPDGTGSPGRRSDFVQRLGKEARMLLRNSALLLLAWGMESVLCGQEVEPITTLPPSAVFLEENWLVYSVWEELTGEDLNDDGDLRDSVGHVRNLMDGSTINLGLALDLENVALSTTWFAFGVSEKEQAEDLNGDGDQDDLTLYAMDLRRAETTMLDLSGAILGLAGKWLLLNTDKGLCLRDLEQSETTELGTGRVAPSSHAVPLSERWLAFLVSEQAEAKDLNGDGDDTDMVLHTRELLTGTTTNLALAIVGGRVALSGDRLVAGVSERAQETDLNGDGDLLDIVLHTRELARNQTTNIGTAVHELFALNANWLVFFASELGEGADLNGDGDLDDFIMLVRDLERNETVDLGLAVGWRLPCFVLSPPWLVLALHEEGYALQVRNLNRSEATTLGLARTHPSSPGIFAISGRRLVFQAPPGDRPSRPLQVLELETGVTTELGLNFDPGWGCLSSCWTCDASLDGYWDLSARRLAVTVWESDPHSIVATRLVDLEQLSRLVPFLRGDCNDDGNVDISDAVSTLGSLFLGQGDPSCDDACDANDDGAVDISDAVATLGALFLGEGPIPLPGMTHCGVDPTADEVTCETVNSCAQ